MKNTCAKIVKIIFVDITTNLQKGKFPDEFNELKEFIKKINESKRINALLEHLKNLHIKITKNIYETMNLVSWVKNYIK